MSFIVEPASPITAIPVTVPQGGTGLTTLTANNLLVGNGTSTPQFIAPGTSTNVLTSNGTSWVSGAAPSASIVQSNRTSNTILGSADKGTLINVTSGTFTQTLTAAATLGSGWFCYISNAGTGTVTVDPNGSETIGGVTTATLRPGDFWLIICTGTAFTLERIAGGTLVQLTSGTTYTVEAGVYKLYVECFGAGGGGGKGFSVAISAGGGAGGYSAGWLDVTPGQSITYAIGSGGAGATTAGSGSAGGNTTFAGVFTANGGAGATVISTGFNEDNTTLMTLGGTASGGSINIQGAFGGGSAGNLAAGVNLSYGGAAPNGGSGGAMSVDNLTNKTQNAQIPGGGGRGGRTSGSAINGETGARGEVRVRFI